MSDAVFYQNQFNSIVQTFEHFQFSTGFPIFLCNRLCNTDATSVPIVQKFMTDMNLKFATYDALLAAFSKMTLDTQASPKLQNWLLYGNQFSGGNPYITNYLQATSYATSIVNIFSIQMAPIETYSHVQTAYPPEFLTNMRSAFISTFMMIYGEIKEEVCTSANNAGTSCSAVNGSTAPPITNTNMLTYLTALLHQIEGKVYQYTGESDGTVSGFLAQLYDDLMSRSSQGLGQIHLNLIATVFLPYFNYLYLLSFLPTAHIVSSNLAPRDGVVRGLAILSIYKFISYFLFGVYYVIAEIDPGHAVVQQLLNVIDMNVTSLFNNQIENVNHTLKNVQSESSHQRLAQNISNLEGVNQQITMARSNVNNISNNQTAVTKLQRRNAAYKWTWLAILIIYLIVATGLLIMISFSNSADASLLIILTSVLLAIVLIFTLVS